MDRPQVAERQPTDESAGVGSNGRRIIDFIRHTAKNGHEGGLGGIG